MVCGETVAEAFDAMYYLEQVRPPAELFAA